jgi:hypothetical protein
METTTLRDLQAALNRKSGFEMVDHTDGDSQLRIMGRQKKDAMGVNLNNWFLVIRNLLQRHVTAPWKVDVSKMYFLRGETVIYGWRLIFQTGDGSSLEPHVPDIVAAIMGAPHTARGELTEYPLPGASADRNISDGRSRGVHNIKEGVPFIPGAR